MPERARDSTRYFSVLGLPGLEVVAVHWMKRSSAPHMHDFYSLSLNYAGRGAGYWQHQLCVAVPGTCSLIAPGELHSGNPTSRQGWVYRSVQIEITLMNRLLRSLDGQGPVDVSFKSPLVTDSVLAKQLERFFASSVNANSLIQIESLLLCVIARLATKQLVPKQSIRQPGSEPLAILRTKDWLHAYPDRNISIHSLADFVGLSPYYLVRAFHKYVGVPPHAYQMILRVHKARILLKSGMPISEVACRTGFYDQSHLTRSFKATFGVTPGAYIAHCGTGWRAEHLIRGRRAAVLP